MIVLYDDGPARAFAPLAATRPLSDVRVGALLTRERWAMVLGASPCAFISAPHLRAFADVEAAAPAPDELPAGAWVVNTRAVVPPVGLSLDGVSSLRVQGVAAAVRLAAPTSTAAFASGLLALDTLAGRGAPSRDLGGHWLDAPWDIIRQLSDDLVRDLPPLAATLETQGVTHAPADGVSVLGGHAAWIEVGAVVEPMTVFDTRGGPILVRRGARIEAFTRLIGPCHVGADSTILGGRIAASAIGEGCRIHGDVSVSSIQGQSNKAHDGFVGHSLIGRWVNLGAGTTTSNLKSTYGEISLGTSNGRRATGMQFLGSLLGDYVKTGIGLRLSPGTCIGAGAILTDAPPPRDVPAFAWGASVPYGQVTQAKFLETTERMMQRRNLTVSARVQQHLANVFAHATGTLSSSV